MSKASNKEDSMSSRFFKIYSKVDASIDAGLEKTNSVLDQIIKLINAFFSFLKKSLEVKQLKKVFFILIMSIAMAFVFVGVNIFFGKIIL